MTTPLKKSPLVVIRVIWLALLLSQIQYFFIARISIHPEAAPSLPYPWGPAYAILAVILGLVSVILSNSRLSAEALARLFNEWPPEKALGKAFASYVICWALNEGVAILGLVQSFRGQNRNAILPFLAAGLALQALMYPRLKPDASQAAPLGPA